MNKGNVYNIVVKYPNSLGGVKFTDLKLLGEFIGPDIIRNTMEPNIDLIWFNIQSEAQVGDIVKVLNINDLVFYVFKDINNKNVILAKEWISSYTEAGNDFKFEVKNITIEQKMVLIKRLKELGIVTTEI